MKSSFLNNIRSVIIIVLILLVDIHWAHATHNRAGEITYRQTGPLTVEVTITTYTKTSSTAADRDSLDIIWGDGSIEIVTRTGSGTKLANDVKKNEYTAEHTYPGRGTYTVAFQDPNRVGNILNVNYPNSLDVPFYLATTFTLLNTQFQGFNNSAQLLQPPIDIACVRQPFTHNPNAFDPDGDSLSYSLVAPLQGPGEPVPNYKFPHQILPGPDNIAVINPVTGTFTWLSPPQEGEYNIAIRINEYRKGFLINSIIRDMQVRVIKCDNRPPKIEAIRELCVVAGDEVDIDLKISDPDLGQQVYLTGTGGPFNVDQNKATLSNADEYLDVDFTSKFKWQTTCEHVSREYYQVAFRAIDNYLGDTTGLASFHILRIKVVAPPPDSLIASAEDEEIVLEWDLPYVCESATEFFRGFSIWRRESPNPFVIDSCETGLEDHGYQEVVFLTNQNDGQKYFHIDQGLEKAITYCYRIQSEFSLSTSSGSLYNRVESLPSSEVCLQISRDLPIITKVSVDETSANQGQIHVRWTKPLIEQLDTLENPPPYRIEVWRSLIGENDFAFIPQSRTDFTNMETFQDTNFFDTGLNTLASQYEYKIQLYTNGDFATPFGYSKEASSIYTNSTSSDRRLTLDWDANTPWTNNSYKVFRRDDNSMWELLDETRDKTYLDLNLENGKEYCYYVEATGSYALPSIEDPLINLSQIFCARPLDNVPPCAPKLTVTNICEDLNNFGTVDEFINTLSWNDPNIFCDRTEPIGQYYIYFSPDPESEFVLLDSVSGISLTTYDHIKMVPSLSGCYAVTALDQLGNESEFSNIVCKENCPIYELPNTFTPNQDGANDVFKPIRNLFISKVEFKVFNEWGNLVYETTDPDLNWNGTLSGNGSDLNPATYYYSCNIFTQNGSAEVQIAPPLSGYIQLIR